MPFKKKISYCILIVKNCPKIDEHNQEIYHCIINGTMDFLKKKKCRGSFHFLINKREDTYALVLVIFDVINLLTNQW
jgi:hypothetical protein